jgi:hypothetical protein
MEKLLGGKITEKDNLHFFYGHEALMLWEAGIC